MHRPTTAGAPALPPAAARRPVVALFAFALVAVSVIAAPRVIAGQEPFSTPVRQAESAPGSLTAAPLTLRDASRDDRWFGLGVRDVRWAPDGSAVYFRWNRRPTSADVPDEDPWFASDPAGREVRELTPAEIEGVPDADVVRSPDGRRTAWSRGGNVYLHDAPRGIRRIAALPGDVAEPHFGLDGERLFFQAESILYGYDIDAGALIMVARTVARATPAPTDAGAWLRNEQLELFDHLREQERRRTRSAEAARAQRPPRPQAIPVAPGMDVEGVRISPDGRWLVFRTRTRATDRPATEFVDYVDASGYATVREARAKVGEPRDVWRLGVVAVDPSVPDDSVQVRWVEVAEAGDQATVPHGPSWSPDGSRAIVQFLGEGHRDLWFAELDLENATARVLVHDHDDAWIGGPPVQGGRLQPAFAAWLPDGRLAFASERTGWSHLYLLEEDETVRPLTEGAWEVRGASLSPDGSTWLIQGSREHPSEDHLYRMPAEGGPLERLTSEGGRNEGWWSPDGRRLAIVRSESTALPDLYLAEAEPEADEQRVTVSGTDAFHRHPLVRPEMVRMTHPDGGPVWAAVYRPRNPNAQRSALVHVHGGGYRQFAHRGYSVYGWALHLGFIHYMLEQGYTVLDFDYRGSAGFGRDYRTDIANSMGISDTDGAVAAARWLVDEEGVDPERIGIYGVSYGGFLTLTSLFRYPGVFSAGIARAAVTDWAHYSDGWTSRILGVPHADPEAYRRSSPIYYAEGLEDPLLLTHGLVDDNVHFQDAARLIQRLIELEKDFEVMVYPVEPHTVATEASRYDLLRRQAAFFDLHLRDIRR